MKKTPSPPTRLSREARALYRRIVGEYGVDDAGGLAILSVACESLDRLRQAQQAIEADGPITLDRFGQQRPHVMLQVEKDSRAHFLAAIKQLGLDIEPLGAVGRPPGGRR